jgi:hypothetical protein
MPECLDQFIQTDHDKVISQINDHEYFNKINDLIEESDFILVDLCYDFDKEKQRWDMIGIFKKKNQNQKITANSTYDYFFAVKPELSELWIQYFKHYKNIEIHDIGHN